MWHTTTGTAPSGTCRPPGRTWPPRTPCPPTTDCDGCHGRKAAAISAAEAAITGAEGRIRDAERRIGICEDTTEILDPLTRRLQAALQALRQVPHDLGEVYELIYAFIRRGGKMPHPGRWITGETPVPA